MMLLHTGHAMLETQRFALAYYDVISMLVGVTNVNGR